MAERPSSPPTQIGAPAQGTIRTIAVVADYEKAPVRRFVEELVPWLRSRVGEVALAELSAFVQGREAAIARGEAGDLPDLVVVLGGDGAMLAAVRSFRRSPVPTLGINFGRVGFLAATPVSHWRETLAGILAGEGVIEPRMRLSFTVEGDDGRRGISLNDVVVNRSATQRMLTVSLSVGDTWVTDYRADGVIIATPSGSTAYSLSAGGPILLPSMQALVVTPICPQGLASRPIVLDPETTLAIELANATGLTSLVADGQKHYPLEPGSRVVVERHPVSYPLLNMPDLDPYRRLRERLGWSYNVGSDRR